MSAQFEIDRREVDGVVVLDLKGRLVAGDASNLLRETIQREVAAGAKSTVLNLAKCDFIDSTGLGAMVIAFTSLRKAGGALKLCHLTERNVELLVLTKLSTIFEVLADEQDAINSFYPERKIKHFDILSFVQRNKEDVKDPA